MTAYSALVAMFNNPALCPGTNTAKSGLLKNMETYISHLPTADAATCITGSASDATLCGFTDATQKTSYCAANAGDRCCGTNTVNPAPTGIPPVPSAGSGGLATVTGTATGVGYVPTPTVSVASNNNQTNTINLFGQKVPAPYVIGGAVGAGVLLLAVIGVVVFVIRKRRAAKDDINSPVEHPTLFKNKFKRDPSLPRDSNQFSQPGQMQQQQQFNQSPYKYPPAAAQGAWSEQGFQQADDTAVLSPAPIAQDEELPPAETMEVAFNYVPNLSDEIYLYVGDPIIVKCKFDDGWAFGFNMTTKQEGCFPVACVVPLNTAAATDTESQTKSKTQSIISAKDYKKRQSSLYAPSNIVKGLPDEWQTDSNNNTNMDVNNNTYSVYTSAQGNQRETQYTEYTNDPRQTQYTQYTETQYTEANNRDTQYTEYTQYTGAGNNRETQYTEYTQYTEGTNFGNRPYTEYTEYTVAPSSRK
ncbi:hypothetical protein HK098_003711 [Nowakowskiella sp. JEL0407]|nr:hypothetical protein HK098_003711 [Nowakowskiella sp. JEL0407]